VTLDIKPWAGVAAPRRSCVPQFKLYLLALYREAQRLLTAQLSGELLALVVIMFYLLSSLFGKSLP
jgi:hypothetical protein